MERRNRDVAGCLGLRKLSRADFRRAAEVAAHGMGDDPLATQVFGSDPDRRRRLVRFYIQIIRFIEARGDLCGAFEHGRLVGVMGTMRPGFCQPNALDALRMIPTLMATISPGAAFRLKHWIDEWARHDLGETHWHVGLLSVEPQVQGLGVGTKLMARHCARMDAAQAVSYLETDQARNVRFYQKFGYGVFDQAPVLGISNWFLKRNPVVPANEYP